MAKLLKELFETMPQVGTVEWIGTRAEKRGNVQLVDQVEVSVENGIFGDHYSRKGGKRMVTLIQKEHVDTVASIMQLQELDPTLLRRNIVVSGINLLALKDQQFQIGATVILQMTGLCHPCSRMEANLGAGGYNAMRGHGGITAKVLQGGSIHVGDKVQLLSVD